MSRFVFSYLITGAVLLLCGPLTHCDGRALGGPLTITNPDGGRVAVTTDASNVWEYRMLLAVPGTHEKTGPAAASSNEVILDESMLNQLGADGWELKTSWLEMETAYPNLGKDAYVTGLRDNVRPMRAVMLFGRHKWK